MTPMGILPELFMDIENAGTDTIIEESEENYGDKKTFRFNFESGEFETDVAGTVLTTSSSEELLMQAVDKILHDARYKYLIYSDNYGNEVDYILAQDDPPEVVEMELKRVYTEALIYHPLISNVGNFEFENDGDCMYCNFVVEGRYGDRVKFREEVKTWTKQMF